MSGYLNASIWDPKSRGIKSEVTWEVISKGKAYKIGVLYCLLSTEEDF